jgi:hypothetical protein
MRSGGWWKNVRCRWKHLARYRDSEAADARLHFRVGGFRGPVTVVGMAFILAMCGSNPAYGLVVRRTLGTLVTCMAAAAAST